MVPPQTLLLVPSSVLSLTFSTMSALLRGAMMVKEDSDEMPIGRAFKVFPVPRILVRNLLLMENDRGATMPLIVQKVIFVMEIMTLF